MKSLRLRLGFFYYSILIAALIMIGTTIAVLVVFSNILGYSLAAANLGNVTLSDNCTNNVIPVDMLHEFGPGGLASLRLVCFLNNGRFYENESYVICAFNTYVNVDELCEPVSKFGQYCREQLHADWLCYKTEVSCRCG